MRALCVALADGTVTLDAGADREAAGRALRALPGVDPAVAAYIRMRALGDPDVGPVGGAARDAWRPWRSYALHHLWQESGTGPQAGQLTMTAPVQAPTTSRQARSSVSTASPMDRMAVRVAAHASP